jgi:hypothetical protein
MIWDAFFVVIIAALVATVIHYRTKAQASQDAANKTNLVLSGMTDSLRATLNTEVSALGDTVRAKIDNKFSALAQWLLAELQKASSTPPADAGGPPPPTTNVSVDSGGSQPTTQGTAPSTTDPAPAQTAAPPSAASGSSTASGVDPTSLLAEIDSTVEKLLAKKASIVAASDALKKAVES